MSRPEVERLARDTPWDGVRAVVIGFDGPGFAAADNLLHLGARVTVLAEGATPAQLEKAELLEILGAHVELHSGATTHLRDGVDLVVTSTALADDHPVLTAARERDLPLWGDVELAWRLRPTGPTGVPAPWLCVAGGSGIGRAAGLLDEILRAAGLLTIVTGSGELPVVEAVMDPAPYDAFIVELTGAQLRHVRSTSPVAAVVLDVGDDPWAAELGRAYEQVQEACAYPVAIPAVKDLVREADVVEGARAVGYTEGMPSVGMLGVVEDLFVDRAFIAERATSAAELATLTDLVGSDREPDPGLVTDALAAATLARAVGVVPLAVRDGLRAYRPG